jgi:lysophospholipase L1-like esterase
MCRRRWPRTDVLFLLSLPLALVSCGGGSPTSPSPDRPTHSVVVVVFYDENGDGSWQTTEAERVPDVVVEVGGRTGRSEKGSGRVVIDGVPEGTYPVTARAESLPPFYQTVSAVRPTVSSPQAGGDAFFPLVLPVGPNRPGAYLGFGDSITVGDGSSSGNGYRDILQARLEGHFGMALVLDGGKSGSKSNAGAKRVADEVAYARPSYTLILYGTNDWNDLGCKIAFPCFTIDSLRSMVRSVKTAQSLPVLATIIPVNPDYEFAADRNSWISAMNELIRPLAQQEGAVLADLHAAFTQAGDLKRLFSDKVHPNDEGYRIIAEEYFRAIVTPTGAGARSVSGEGLLLSPWSAGLDIRRFPAGTARSRHHPSESERSRTW